MSSLSEIGATIEVRPWDDTIFRTSKTINRTIVDRTMFSFTIDELLFDSRKVVDVCGRVVLKNSRYDGLICNAIIRADDPKWMERTSSNALLKIGSKKIRRVEGFDVRHPDGTRVDDYPVYITIGEIMVQKYPSLSESTADEGP